MTNDLATYSILVGRYKFLLDPLAAETLVKTFGMVVRHKFLHDVVQVPLTEEDKVVQAFAPDRFDKTLCVWAAIRTLGRDLHALDSAGPQGCIPRRNRASLPGPVGRYPRENNHD